VEKATFVMSWQPEAGVSEEQEHAERVSVLLLMWRTLSACPSKLSFVKILASCSWHVTKYGSSGDSVASLSQRPCGAELRQ
jgi:hypothetical protein